MPPTITPQQESDLRRLAAIRAFHTPNGGCVACLMGMPCPTAVLLAPEQQPLVSCDDV